MLRQVCCQEQNHLHSAETADRQSPRRQYLERNIKSVIDARSTRQRQYLERNIKSVKDDR